MKQYDKIWVPEKKQGFAMRDAEGDTPSLLVGPVIVLTVEELKKVWDNGANWGTRCSGVVNPYPDFPAYLQSKEIKV